MLGLTVFGRDWRDTGQLLFIAIVVGMVTLIATLGVYASTNSPSATVTDSSSTELTPAITTTSGQGEIALANHLKQIDAKMYGAYWCPHCHDQKQLFGKAAFGQINYVECDPGGINPQPDLCKTVGVQSYPTWEINGKLYPGTKDLPTLAKLSGYQGPQNFQNTLPRPQT